MLLACNMKLFTEKTKTAKKVISKKWVNPVIIKKSDKNRIKTIKITKQ